MPESGDLFTSPPPVNNPTAIAEYAENAYLAYAVSVVKGRALPMVEDGQKPVQRRILYAMHRMGLLGAQKHVKSARVVGEVLGKYHPHGDSSAYEAAVRMAQPFTLRYPLIDGQGNFGSLDGDGAAAMRYTEVRLTPIAELLMSEVDSGTVDFVSNYDGSFQEPSLLPARLPFIFLNGASGIAVGMATEIPPHNLREVSAAAVSAVLCESREAILAHIPGPDFPGGGHVITSPAEIQSIYASGRGSIRVRARWVIEQMARGQWRAIVTELPPGISTKSVLSDIEVMLNPKPGKGKKTIDQAQAALKQLASSMIDTVRDESGRSDAGGNPTMVRIVIEPKTGKIDPDQMMSMLMLNAGLESSAPINLTMIGIDGRPGQKGIAQAMMEWAEFRIRTVRRRLQSRLDKVNHRLHILAGRKIVFLNIERVIQVIRESDDPKAALIAEFDLTEIQADDILEIRLRQLARLEGIAIEKEIADLEKEKSGIEALLASDAKLRRHVVSEIEADAKKYGDDRRTLIEAAAPVAKATSAAAVSVPDEPVTVTLTANGWIKSRSGHGLDALVPPAGDRVLFMVETRTRQDVYLLSSDGRSYSIPAHEIPAGKGDGAPVTSIISLAAGHKIVRMISGAESDVYMFTSSGGYGFMAPLKSLWSRQKAGKAFMTVDYAPATTILEPVRIVDGLPWFAVRSSGDRMLCFPVSEMKVLENGGKGVMVMDINDGIAITDIRLFDGETLEIPSRKGMTKLSGEPLNKYLLHRARKGCQV